MLKNLKRIISAITASALLLSCAYAQEGGATLVNIDENTLKSLDIVCQDGGKLTKNGDMYEKKSSYAGTEDNKTLVNFGKMDKNAVINMDMKFDFTDKTGGMSAFDGFQLRASTQDKACWTTDCYVVIIREKSVEIQVFAKGGGKFLLNRTCEIPKDKKVNVKTGAIDTDEGVYVFVKIDDQVFSAVDKKSLIKDGGYFNLEWRSNLMMYPASDDSYIIPKAAAEYDVESNTVKASVDFISDGKTQNAETKYEWYISNGDFKNPQKTITNMEETFTKIDGEENDTLAVMNEDIGKYVYVTAITDGVKTASQFVYISPSEYLKKNAFIACVGYTGAIAKGESFVLDKENPKVYPDVAKDGYVYLPIRAVAEAYKMPVSWDGDIQKISIIARPDSTAPDTEFRIGYQGFIVLRALMGSSMPGTPYISEGRTFLDTSATMQILAYNYEFYDEQSGLIILSNIKPDLSKQEISDLAYDISEIK